MADAVFEEASTPVPTRITINGKDEVDNLATKSTGSVDIGYDISQAMSHKPKQRCRVMFRVSNDNFVTYFDLHTEWRKFPVFTPGDGRFHFTISGLAQNTKYRVRAYTVYPEARSLNFNSFEFWTNRAPNQPELIDPVENAAESVGAPVTFDWKFSDPDPSEAQSQYNLQWRQMLDDSPPGPWNSVTVATAATTATLPGTTFTGNRHYEWRIRYADGQGLWSDWSLSRSFYVVDLTSPPLLLYPIKDQAVDVLAPVRFEWLFLDPDPGDSQAKADLRYRPVGTNDWLVIAGASSNANAFAQIAAENFTPGLRYEWQVATYDVFGGGTIPSKWTESATFYAIRTPGELAKAPLIGDQIIRGAIGCGHNRVFVYQQGGQVRVGEITSIQQVIWRRQRDDISNCVIDTSGFDSDCGDLLSRLRSWQHELVVFRDDKRVWEGPITRITYTASNVEIEAKDVMNYVYRRIMRQGYDDSYNLVGGVQLGLNTVVYRAARIITDALARGDPNVLPYLTPLNNPFDARQSRVVPDFSKTAWEEVDDLAATAGLDYVTVGRRIILFDTHYPIGKLPEMRDGDFTDPVIVTEYGMNLCNYYGVTDGAGEWGAAYPLGLGQNNYDEFYGPIELLSSSYGDSQSEAQGATTPAAVAALRARYATQAQRNIGNRWPTPVVVRVPDNTSINPEVSLDINHLIPGVWIPLRSTAALREVSQWQKLDSMTVTENPSDGEKIAVVLSPAPNGGNDDPDAVGQIGDG